MPPCTASRAWPITGRSASAAAPGSIRTCCGRSATRCSSWKTSTTCCVWWKPASDGASRRIISSRNACATVPWQSSANSTNRAASTPRCIATTTPRWNPSAASCAFSKAPASACANWAASVSTMRRPGNRASSKRCSAAQARRRSRTASALLRVSSASSRGSESSTTPAPARTRAIPSRTSAERMTMLVSRLPALSRMPIAPP